MSITTIILMNIGVAAVLVAILAAVMLAPSRLRGHFPDGHLHLRRPARAERRRAAARTPHGRRQGDVPWHPIEEN